MGDLGVLITSVIVGFLLIVAGFWVGRLFPKAISAIRKDEVEKVRTHLRAAYEAGLVSGQETASEDKIAKGLENLEERLAEALAYEIRTSERSQVDGASVTRHGF